MHAFLIWRERCNELDSVVEKFFAPRYRERIEDKLVLISGFEKFQIRGKRCNLDLVSCFVKCINKPKNIFLLPGSGTAGPMAMELKLGRTFRKWTVTRVRAHQDDLIHSAVVGQAHIYARNGRSVMVRREVCQII